MTRAFKNLKADEVLNFSVAVTVMRVQRKWRARMRAAKLKRKREVGPPYDQHKTSLVSGKRHIILSFLIDPDGMLVLTLRTEEK